MQDSIFAHRALPRLLHRGRRALQGVRIDRGDAVCPYVPCRVAGLLSDGTKAKEVEETVSTLDVAELLEKAVCGSGTDQAAS